MMNVVDRYKKRKSLSCIKKVAAVMLLFLWVLFIWHNSLQGADVSGMRSIRITETVNGLLWNGNMILTEHEIRKLAHFFEFAVEGILTVCLFCAFKLPLYRNLCAGALLGIMTALIDETIQLFSIGRDGAVGDVWIDFGGFILGFAVTVLGVLLFTQVCAFIAQTVRK